MRLVERASEPLSSHLAQDHARALVAAKVTVIEHGSRKRPTSGWESLTPTELEGVRLVSEGLTNPQIGGRMFISKGTVRTHLSHVFPKLAVTSRSQPASEATRRAAAG